MYHGTCSSYQVGLVTAADPTKQVYFVRVQCIYDTCIVDLGSSTSQVRIYQYNYTMYWLMTVRLRSHQHVVRLSMRRTESVRAHVETDTLTRLSHCLISYGIAPTAGSAPRGKLSDVPDHELNTARPHAFHAELPSTTLHKLSFPSRFLHALMGRVDVPRSQLMCIRRGQHGTQHPARQLLLNDAAGSVL